MKDFIWVFQGVINVAPKCGNCGGTETGRTETVTCGHCGHVYYQSIKEARQHYPTARIYLHY